MRVSIRRRMWSVGEVADVVSAAGEDADHRDKARGLDGICLYDRGEIWVSSSLRPRQKLETYIHELLHALQPELHEQTVASAARVIACVLHRQGARMK